MAGVDVPLRCKCGQVKGRLRDVRPAQSNRVVCYCKFCVGYANRLMPEVLDADGGSEIVQVSPARLEITEGEDQVACGRMTSKGPLRFYAKCCDTPLANTLPTSKMPFMGIVASACLELPEDAAERAAILGPVRAGVNHTFTGDEAKARQATGGKKALMVTNLAWLMLGWRLKGDQARNWFFDPKTAQPRFEPVRFPKAT